MSIGARSESAELVSACLATTGACKVSASSDGVTWKTAFLLSLSINNCIIVFMSNGLLGEVAGDMSIREGLLAQQWDLEQRGCGCDVKCEACSVIHIREAVWIVRVMVRILQLEVVGDTIL